MYPKDISFISYLVFFGMYLGLFYLIGRFVIKPKSRKIRNLILCIILFLDLIIIVLFWKFVDWNPYYTGISGGFIGAFIGFLAATQPKKEREK